MSAPIAAGIMAAACQHSGFTRSEIKGPSRIGELVRVRQAVMYALIERTAWSLSHIGRYLKRDHSTVSHGRDTARAWMERDTDYAALVEALLTGPELAPSQIMELVAPRIRPVVPAAKMEALEPEPPFEPIAGFDDNGNSDYERCAIARQRTASALLARAIQEARAAA